MLRPFFFGWIILLISFGLFPCKWFYDNFCSKSWRIVESRWRKYEYYLCQPGEFSETPCSWIALNICSIKQKVFFFPRRNWVLQCRNYKKRCLMMSFAIVKCWKCHSMTEQKFAFKTFSLTFLTILESLFWPHGKNLWKAPLWTSSQIVFHCLV